MIPEYIKPYLWSYDAAEIDIERHRELIITQILNLGSKKSIDWLLETYTRQEIEEVVSHPRRGVWNKKSYNFWTILLGIPKQQLGFWPA